MTATTPLCIPDAARWNEYIAVPLAFGVNFFVAFLIRVKSPKSLKIYNRVLLTNCAFNLMFSAACLIVGFVSFDALCSTLDSKNWFSTFRFAMDLYSG